MDVNKKCGLDYSFTEIEEIRNKAFSLVKKLALYSICFEETQSKIGRVINNPYDEVVYLYYWVDYLTLMRNEIDRIILLNGCITNDELNAIYKKYDIDCILSKSMCSSPLYRQILDLFKPIFGLCENLIEWDWIAGNCEITLTVEWLWLDDFTCELYQPPFPFRLLEDYSYRLLETNDRRYLE